MAHTSTVIMTSTTSVASVQALLSLLTETENALKIYALQQLDLLIARAWPEIAEHITEMYVK